MNEPLNEIPSSPPPAPVGVPTNQEKQWALFTHLSALLGIFIFPFAPFAFANLLGPLIFWQIKKNEMPFVEDQGKEALNFQLTFTIVMIVLIVVGTPLLFFLIGVLFYLAALVVFIAWLVLTILAAVRANNGEYYRYPWCWRLVK